MSLAAPVIPLALLSPESGLMLLVLALFFPSYSAPRDPFRGFFLATSAVAEALESLGITTEIMEVGLDLESIEKLPSRRPVLVFNLVGALDCDGRFAPLVPARLGIAYTGCSTRALLETLSKVGTKLTLAQAGLPTPEWSADGTGLNCDARVIVKAVWEHGSLGLDKTSVLRCADARGPSPHALCGLRPSISPKPISRDVNSILPCLRGFRGRCF